MPEDNINQEFRLKKVDEIRNYLIGEVNQNELMSKKHKKVCMCFYFCFYFFSWNFHRNYEFCNRIKNLCNSGRN